MPALRSLSLPFGLILLASAALAQKMPDVRLDVGSPAGSSTSVNPVVAADGSSVYVAWVDSRNGLEDVYFNRSNDGGDRWLASDLRLDGGTPGASLSGSPRIAATGGAVYVVWGEDWTGVRFRRSLDRGASWSPPRLLDSDGVSYQVAASGSAVYVVWQDGPDIRFDRSLDQGDTWLPASVRADVGSPAFSLEPQLAASGAAVYVTWGDGMESCCQPSDILFNRSLDGGSTWLASPVRLDSAAGLSIDHRLAASGSVVGVTWEDHRNGPLYDVFCNCSTDGGSTWLAQDVKLDDPGGVDTHPEITVSGSAVYVAWMRGQTDIHFNRSLDGGASWLSATERLDTLASPDPSYTYFPMLAASDSSVFAAWVDAPPALPSAMAFNRSLNQGASWLPAQVRLDHPFSHGRIAASGASVYAVWSDGRDGASDVYFGLLLGFQPYGHGKPGSGGFVPTISGSGDVSIGGTFAVEIANGLGGASGLLLVGTNGRRPGAILVQGPLQTLPFVLGGSAGAPGAGSASISFPLPNNMALIGTQLNLQARIFDPHAPRGHAMVSRLTLSGGLEAWIL